MTPCKTVLKASLGFGAQRRALTAAQRSCWKFGEESRTRTCQHRVAFRDPERCRCLAGLTSIAGTWGVSPWGWDPVSAFQRAGSLRNQSQSALTVLRSCRPPREGSVHGLRCTRLCIRPDGSPGSQPGSKATPGPGAQKHCCQSNDTRLPSFVLSSGSKASHTLFIQHAVRGVHFGLRLGYPSGNKMKTEENAGKRLND